MSDMKANILPACANDEYVVKVEHVSKKFCSNLRRSMFYGTLDVAKTMCGISNNRATLRKHEFWALQDIDFSLKRGETLGIIGENGSGKSTLLRLINGIFPPDAGKITIRGSISALIAIGAGFHPHMTGRENIYLNGAILGMTAEEIGATFHEIIDFAELGDFIDAPVSTYSSGMYVRLGFSIAIHANPDILLVDEILAVGDANFQKKCFEKILDLRSKGMAIVFVSHAIGSIERLCTSCLLMKRGRSLFFGSTRECVQKYFFELGQSNVNRSKTRMVGIGDVVFSDVIVYQEGCAKNDPNIEFGKNIVIEFKYRFLKEKGNRNQVRLGIRTYEGHEVQKIFFHEAPFQDGIVYPNEKLIALHKEGFVKVTILNPRWFPQTFLLDLTMDPLDVGVALGGMANAASFNIIHPRNGEMYLEYGNMTVTEFDYDVVVEPAVVNQQRADSGERASREAGPYARLASHLDSEG